MGTDPKARSAHEEEQKVYFFEFLTAVLLRGDFVSRTTSYATMRTWGIMSANDIRDLENMNRIENGDIYLQPLNMVEAGTPPPPPATTSPFAPKAILAPEEIKALEMLPPQPHRARFRSLRMSNKPVLFSSVRLMNFARPRKNPRRASRRSARSRLV
jgi:hypothetical protein